MRKKQELDEFEKAADRRADPALIQQAKKCCAICPNKGDCPFTRCGYVTRRYLCLTMDIVESRFKINQAFSKVDLLVFQYENRQ